MKIAGAKPLQFSHIMKLMDAPYGCSQVMVANRNYMKSQTTKSSYQIFIAQLIERLISNQKTVGSSPTSGETITLKVNNLFNN